MRTEPLLLASMLGYNYEMVHHKVNPFFLFNLFP